MATSITWRGGAGGAWTTPQNWSGFALPGLSDAVSIGAGGTAAIGPGIAALAGALALPGGTLLVDAGAVLRVAGTIALAGGTLDLAGRLVGGTLAPGGTLIGEAGTLDGTVVRGGLSGLGNLTITQATVAANAALPIAPFGTLTLAAGRYDGATFRLDAANAVGGGVELAAASGRTVLLGATSAIAGDAALAVLGGGTFTNQGSIALAPAMQVQTQIFYAPTGKFDSLVGSALTWTQAAAPTLDIAAASFTNTGLVCVSGGTLELTGADFRNTGSILLADATAQTVRQAADGTVSIVATTLATSIEVAASVTDFVNTGTIGADSIAFDGAVRLPLLGTLFGALDFAGTLDLGGGTLDAAARQVTISGTVAHGALGGGGLLLAGATLRGVTLAAGTAEATGTLALGLGGLTINAGAGLAASGTVLLEGAAGGAIGNGGSIAAAADATVTLQAALGGAGTVELGDNAVVSVDRLALFARPTFLFDPGASLLSLPGTGAGVTLADLHAGDVLDFRDISSIPAKPGAHGTAYEVGNALDVIGASGQTALLALTPPAHGIGFIVGADGHGGTLVTVG